VQLICSSRFIPTELQYTTPALLSFFRHLKHTAAAAALTLPMDHYLAVCTRTTTGVHLQCCHPCCRLLLKLFFELTLPLLLALLNAMKMNAKTFE
jgi:hypothetical protein